MSDKIYVLIDHENGQIATSSLESLSFGRELSRELRMSLCAFVLGHKVQGVVDKLASESVDTVVLVQDSKLGQYDPDYHCEAICQIMAKDCPYILLMGHTYQNIDLAPKLAARLNTALVTGCKGYRRQEETLLFVRQMFHNQLNADVLVKSAHPWIITMQPGAIDVDNPQRVHTEVVERVLNRSAVVRCRQSLEIFEAIRVKVDLSRAERIVAVGRGIREENNLKIIEDLAEELGAEIAASRPVVDNEWLGRERQIGSSGQTVSPRLYLACGISGAVQHIVGMKNSECIVAINTDPNAPIFNIATYGVVGDICEVVPKLTKRLKGVRKS